jgi:hypothetical protein
MGNWYIAKNGIVAAEKIAAAKLKGGQLSESLAV